MREIKAEIIKLRQKNNWNNSRDVNEPSGAGQTDSHANNAKKKEPEPHPTHTHTHTHATSLNIKDILRVPVTVRVLSFHERHLEPTVLGKKESKRD